jgi:hypothetical protein
MTAKKDKLAEMTNLIAGSLESTNGKDSRTYEYSASFLAPKARNIPGLWKVTEHTVDGVPYAEAFCAATLRGIGTENICYDATHEFTQNLCVKRVMIYGDLLLDGGRASYDYRMNLALSWEFKGDGISVLPVLGYQYTSIDAQPAAVKDLPPSNGWLDLSIRFEDEYMVLEDGGDLKKLRRIDS